MRLYRIGLGLLLTLDALSRFSIVQVFYSDQGVLPRFALSYGPHPTAVISLFMFSGSWWWATGLFLLQGLSGVLLIFGVEEQLISLLAFVLLVSVHHRNDLVVFGYDILLGVITFWSILLPRRSTQKNASAWCDGVSVSVTAQIVLVYVCAGWLKSSSEWLWHPHAAYYALSADFYSAWTGDLLRHYSKLVMLLTLVTILLERFAWLFFFSPWRMARVRTIAIGVLMALHAGFAFFMDLGLFPLADIVLLSLLLPSEFWQMLEFKPAPVAKPSIPSSRFMQVLASSFLLLVLWWNVQDFSSRILPIPEKVRWGILALGLNQNWGMFAPLPMREGGWVVGEGWRASGKKVDVLHMRDEPPSFMRPVSVAQDMRNRHWLDYLVHIALFDQAPDRARLADYLCDEWSREKHENLRRVDLYYVRRSNDETRPTDYFPTVIAARNCHAR